MSESTLPKAQNWNSYWSREETKRFTKVSWSKRRIMSILNEYVKEGTWALDAGCGSGFFSRFFCDRAMKTVALDYSDEALNLVKKTVTGSIETLKQDLVHDSLKDSVSHRFHIIFSDGLLEHFSSEDQNRIINNLTSVLREDGVLITFVPNRFSPWELIRPFYMPGIEEEPFTLKQLVGVNERNGLAVKRQGGINTFPFALSPDKFCGAHFGMLLFTVSQKI